MNNTTRGHFKSTYFSGKHIGEFTLIEKINNLLWVCQCSCGTIENRSAYGIHAMRDKRCNTCKNNDNIKNEIIGEKYGKWTIISHYKGGKWNCMCACGKISVFSHNFLIKNTPTSCYRCQHLEKRKDIIGQRFGKWLVLSSAIEGETIDKEFRWVCQCDCGKISKITDKVLRGNRNKSCLQCVPRKKPYGVAAFNTLFTRYKYGAKNRGLCWELDAEYFRGLTKQNCYYTGLPPSSVIKEVGGDYIYNGIDRLDSSKGYTVDNCVPCNGKVNQLKMDLGYSEFIELCYLICKKATEKLQENNAYNNLKAV